MKTEIELLARGICIRNGRLLVCHTRGAHNTYLPGGHIERGESAPISLVREIREELGVRARVGNFLGVVEHSFRQKGRRIHELNLLFTMTLPGLHALRRPLSREMHLDFKWLPIKKLRASDLEPEPLRKLLGKPKIIQRPVVWASTL